MPLPRVRDPLGDILLLPSNAACPAGAMPVSTMLVLARLDRLDVFELRRMSEYRSAAEIERALRRGDIVAVREPRRRVVVELELPPEEVLGPGAVEEGPHEIKVKFVDAWGRGMPGKCEIAPPNKEKGIAKPLDKAGVTTLDTAVPGVCTVKLARAKVPLEKEPPDLPLDDRLEAQLVTRTDLATHDAVKGGRLFKRSVRAGEHVFQLKRQRATVIELEHFTEGGAVFLPGLSPAKLRDGAPRVTGIDALKAVFERAKNEQHVVVTGHHPSVSKERAESIQFLLIANRFAWAALSARVAKAEDKDHIRAWASEPLPEGEWTAETWGKVFDLYVKELAPTPSPSSRLIKHPRIEVHRGKNFVPHVVARDATGDAARYTEMNALNPTKPMVGNRGWNPTWPGETIWLPDEWDPFVDRLVAAGWHAFHGEREVTAPQPPHLEHAPRAIGCGDHHLDHPYESAPERRAKQRRADVVILPDDAVVCSHHGSCDTSSCEVYDPTATELTYMALGQPSRILVRWIVPERYGRHLILRAKSGEVRAKIPISAAGPAGSGFIAFDLGPNLHDEPLDLLMVENEALVAPPVSLNVRAILQLLRERTAALPAGVFDVGVTRGAAHVG